MSEELFIGIVTSAGSMDTSWNGVFKFSQTDGYRGKLLSTKFEIKGGKDLFDLPEELDQDYLHCLIDGHEFATIIWPRFPGGQSIKGFKARLVDTQIRNLIRRVHVKADEKDVKRIALQSPLFCKLFEIRPFIETTQTSPYKISIENAPNTPLSFKTDKGLISIGVSASYTPSGNSLSPKLESTGELKLSFETNVSPTEALSLSYRIERLISLLTFDLIRMDRMSFAILANDPSGSTSEEICPVETASRIEAAKSNIDLHQLPLRLQHIDFGEVLNNFLNLFDPIEQTLNWYRTVTAEERYLEDKFFYCIRMIEGLYRGLNIPASPDREALELVNTISEKLASDASNERLTSFIEERIVPIFRKSWSLSGIIRDLKSEYSEIPTVHFLDERLINRLRGKQAHGSSQRHSTSELQFMAYAYRLISMIYCIIVLERCGLSREFLLSGLKECSRFEQYFQSKTLAAFRQECGIS